MDFDRKTIVKSILRFLQDEINGPNLDSEQKECIDVARQCLENTYEIASISCDSAPELIKLFAAKKLEVTEEINNLKAEEYKTKGNNLMKNGKYHAALQEYEKAIQTNPKNPVYYCNRAATNNRLEKYSEAISDCREAIKLDPSYGKAYARLGSAYSNTNMYNEAKIAYAEALRLDPNNTTYQANLKLVEEMLQNVDGTSVNATNFDIGSFMNNPAVINMASQLLNDATFSSMGQQFVQQMQSSNQLMNNLRQSFGIQRTETNESSTPTPTEKDSDPKENENDEF